MPSKRELQLADYQAEQQTKSPRGLFVRTKIKDGKFSDDGAKLHDVIKQELHVQPCLIVQTIDMEEERCIAITEKDESLKTHKPLVVLNEYLLEQLLDFARTWKRNPITARRILENDGNIEPT